MIKKIRYLIICSVFLLLSACVTPKAEFQSKTYQPKKEAVIRYSLSPNIFRPEAVQERRMDAEMKMKSFCGGQKPYITSEKKEEKQTGHYTSTSYSDQSNESSVQQGVVGRQYFDSVGNKSQSTYGSANTVSKPIIKTYNVIFFECR